MGNILRVEDLRLKFGFHHVLNGFDLHVDEDEIVGLIGGNGSGKTMTLRSIMGLESPETEKLEFRGEDIGNLPTHERVELGLSYCPSEEHIFPQMTVKENLEMGSYLHPRETGQAIREVWAMFPILRERMSQLATKLSGGERQMLALSKALMSKPNLLLLDEFSLGLAQKVAFEFSAKVKEVHERGVAVLFVEQNLQLAAEMAQRDYYMVEGKIERENALS